MRRSDVVWGVVIVGILLVIGISQPVFMLVAWRLNIGTSAIFASADLAAIMGAIFTAGGLVTAIVSIYTLVNVQSVVKREIDSLSEQLKQSADERIRTFLDAYGCYTNAQSIREFDSHSIAAMEGWIQEAITREDSISGIYAFAGGRYHYVAALMFLKQRLPLQWGNVEVPDEAQFPDIASRALDYLKRAQDRRDGDAHEIAAQIAELHGMINSPMRDTLKYVTEANAGTHHLLPSGWKSSLFLYGSCRNEHDINALAVLLGRHAPMTADELGEVLSDYVKGPNGKGPLPLVVIPKQGVRDDPWVPGILRIYHQQDGTVGFAQWLPRLQLGGPYSNAGIPPYGERDASGVQSSPPLTAMNDVLSQVAERFYVVDYDDGSADTFPERIVI